jgi:TonB family protein
MISQKEVQPAPLLISKPGNEFDTVKVLKDKEATDKYNEDGETEVEEVYSGKKATETDLKFESPDRKMRDDVFVVVEKMPMYQGGDVELLKYIASNAKYPAGAKEANAEGRVIVRFMVNTQGYAEEVSVLKGVHPLLDEEAVRVVATLTGFEPGMQSGKLVNVWYMVPVNFVLPNPASDPAQPITIISEEGQKPLITVDSVIADIDVSNINSKPRGEYSLPFSIIRRDGTVSTELSKSEDQGNEIIIKYYEGTNLLLSKYETYGTSGRLFKIGNKIGYENVFFPFNLKITKSNFGANTLSRPDINFECLINEPGKWEVTIRTSAEKFPVLQRDEEKTRVN